MHAKKQTQSLTNQSIIGMIRMIPKGIVMKDCIEHEEGFLLACILCSGQLDDHWFLLLPV